MSKTNALKTEKSAQYDASLAEAKLRSRQNEQMQWVQMEWSGSGKERRCTRWDGYMFGRKIASVVWQRAKGYMAWADGRRVVIAEGEATCDVFRTLATAQEEAMFTATEKAFAFVDAMKAVPTFHAWAVRSVAPKAAAATAGMMAFVGWVMSVRELQEAESRAVIEAAQATIDSFNAKFSTKGRQKHKEMTMETTVKKPTLTRESAKETMGNLKRSFEELEAAFDSALDEEGEDIVILTIDTIAGVTKEFADQAKNGFIKEPAKSV
jgi:hypothetical protein